MFTARSGAGKVNAERTFGAMNASGRALDLGQILRRYVPRYNPQRGVTISLPIPKNVRN